MIINFESVGRKYRKLINCIYEQTLKATGNDVEGLEITVSFVDEKTMQDYNKKYRNVDKVTDHFSVQYWFWQPKRL